MPRFFLSIGRCGAGPGIPFPPSPPCSGGRSGAWKGGRAAAALLGAVAFATAMLAAPLPGRAENPGAGEPYILGAYPFSPPSQAVRIYVPIAERFSQALGREVIFRTKSTAEKFLLALAEKKYAIVFVHGFTYIRAHDEFGYQPLARFGPLLKGVVVVRTGSPLQQLTDLRGKTLGSGPVYNPSSILARHALQAVGLILGRTLTLRDYHNSFDCMHAVLSGSIDACAGAGYVLQVFFARNRLKGGLRVIYETKGYPGTLFAARADVPEQERAALRKTILDWGETAEGRAFLKKIRFPAFVGANDAEFDSLRKIKAALK